tara:strand:- start:298 stop:972 length:675 start_codon:yes stop_codon:yes gene_type:complete
MEQDRLFVLNTLFDILPTDINKIILSFEFEIEQFITNINITENHENEESCYIYNDINILANNTISYCLSKLYKTIIDTLHWKYYEIEIINSQLTNNDYKKITILFSYKIDNKLCHLKLKSNNINSNLQNIASIIKNNYTVTDFYFCSILPNFQHSTSNNIDIHLKIYKTNEFVDTNNIEISNIQNTLNMIHNQQIIGSSFEYAPYNLYNWWFTTPKITGEFYEK